MRDKQREGLLTSLYLALIGLFAVARLDRIHDLHAVAENLAHGREALKF
jgi:hypothetical protein